MVSEVKHRAVNYNKNLKGFWKQRKHKRTKILVLVLLSLLIYSTVVCEMPWAPPPISTCLSRIAFKVTRIWSLISKEIKNIISTMVRYGETFYSRHTALNTSCSEVKESNSVWTCNSQFLFIRIATYLSVVLQLSGIINRQHYCRRLSY